MVTCPKGLPVGVCCAIQKNGSVFVQEINACRDAVRRVTITKSAGRGPTSMVTNEAINTRATIYKMILHEAEKARAARAGLSKEQAIQQTCERFPNLYNAYSDRIRRGDAPEELTAPAPTVVVKAGATKAEVEAEIRKRAEPIAAAQKITLNEATVQFVCETPEGKALYAAYCNARP